jgi:pimeloyl-ACP methyl ester carboxylesterase
VTRWVSAPDGVAIAVSEDEGRGAPALFVHGFAHDRSVWAGVAARLSSLVHPWRMDLRGHGESGWSIAGRYAVEDHAADVAAVLSALGPEPATIVAHSLGGHAATLATAARPDRVRALVLVDTGPSLSLAGMLQVASGTAGMLRSHASVAAYRARLDVTYPLADPAALDRLAVSGLVRRRDGRFEPRLDPALLFGVPDPDAIARTESRLWQALSSVGCPTLVVRGAASAMLPAAVAERMVERTLADGRLHTVPRAGHSVMLDAEPELAGRIEAFVRDHTGAIATPGLRTASRPTASAAGPSLR